jgi:hypothetical protein
MKLIADSLSGRSSRAKKLAFPVLVLGAVAGAGLGWVTTAGFLPNLRSSPPAIRPRPGHRRRVHPRRWDGPDPKTTSCPPMQLHSRTRGRGSNAGGWTCRNQSNAQNRLKSFALSRGGAKYYAEQILTGRIANLVIFRLPEFGTHVPASESTARDAAPSSAALLAMWWPGNSSLIIAKAPRWR